MDTSAFAAALDGLFDGPLADGVPADPRFTAITAEVAGHSTAAELAALNLAARLLPPGEAYLEVGTLKGRSMAGALLDAPDRTYVAVESFREFGMLAEASRVELLANLARHGAGHRLVLRDGDCFAVLARPGAVPEPVGVYFYDGAHTGLAHYLALGVVEPLLADEALVLVDDSSYPMVEAATRRYLDRHPGWTVLRDIRAAGDHDPRWANGLLVLAWRRPAGAPRRVSVDVRWRRLVQVYARGPATSLVWRALNRWPGLVPAATRLVPKRSRTVAQPDPVRPGGTD
ncbi:MAG TPA: class I SAM-dependent methyltransferase [Mycobacteriales bacterium]|nr:class I SAM-dependent methyltransferase [Mycobacteriales bacterium]